MTGSTAIPRTLVVVGEVDAPPLRARLEHLAALWSGPLVAVVVGGEANPTGNGPFGSLPEKVAALAAAGDVAAALRSPEPARRGLAVQAILGAVGDFGPPKALYIVGTEPLLPAVPQFAAETFPAEIVLELTGPRSSALSTAMLAGCADLCVVGDADLAPSCGGDDPAFPVRLVPPASTPDALAALREIPLFGGSPALSVVVPVRGRADLVLRLVDSLVDHTPGLEELVLIDDASPDGTLGRLERTLGDRERIAVLANAQQRGFAATVNRGLAAVSGEVVLVVNADTVVTRGWSERLARHLALLPAAGIVGPMSNRVSGHQLLQPVAYDERSLAGLAAFAERLGLEQDGRASGVVRLTGLCVAIPRRTLRRVGGFDPRFVPGNFEDDDYSLRVLAGGLVPYRAEDTFIHHEGSKSFALEPLSYRTLLDANWERFKAKWGLPADREIERHYSLEEIRLQPYDRARHYIAPWRATGDDPSQGEAGGGSSQRQTTPVPSSSQGAAAAAGSASRGDGA